MEFLIWVFKNDQQVLFTSVFSWDLRDFIFWPKIIREVSFFVSPLAAGCCQCRCFQLDSPLAFRDCRWPPARDASHSNGLLNNKLCLSEHFCSEWRFHSVGTLSHVEGKPARHQSSTETLPWRCWLSKYDKILGQITLLTKCANTVELAVATLRLMIVFRKTMRLLNFENNRIKNL